MTDWYLWALALGAVAVAALAWNVPRAPMWIALQALSFCGSSWWHDANLPYAAVVGASSNIVVICALYAYAQRLYELVFWFCFILMLGLDFLSLTNMLNSHWTLAVGLEAANWLALISIGAAGMADRAGIGHRWLGVLRTGPRWASAISRRLNPSRQDLA